MFPTWHRPGGVAEESCTPFGCLRVDGGGDPRAGLLGAGLEAPPRRRPAQAVQQVGTQQFQGPHIAAEIEIGGVDEVGVPPRQGGVEIAVGDPAVAVQSAESRLAQRSLDAVEVRRTPNRLLEGHALQSRQGVDRDEGLQGVVRRHDPGGQRNVAAQPGAAQRGIGWGRGARGWSDGHEDAPAMVGGAGM